MHSSIIKTSTCGEVSEDGVKLPSARDLNVTLAGHWKILINNLEESVASIMHVPDTNYQVTGTWKQLPRTILSSVLCTEYRVPSSWTLLAQTKLSSMYVPLSSVVHHPGYRFLGHPGQMETLCPLVR